MMTARSNTDFLPDFVFMTNFCEGRGYEVKIESEGNGFRCDVYFLDELQKRGKKIFKSCLDAQKASYSALFKLLRKKSNIKY